MRILNDNIVPGDVWAELSTLLGSDSGMVSGCPWWSRLMPSGEIGFIDNGPCSLSPPGN